MTSFKVRLSEPPKPCPQATPIDESIEALELLLRELSDVVRDIKISVQGGEYE